MTDCYTYTQVADFLTKSLGSQLHHILVDEATGKKQMKNITRFSRRDWRGTFDDAARRKQQADTTITDNEDIRPDDTQGGMLKLGMQQTDMEMRFIDVVNLNSMIVKAYSGDIRYLMCNTIEEYIKSEQHRLNIMSQIITEDMKTENTYYGNVVSLNRMYTHTTQETATESAYV